jgi:PKD repeat protein
MKAFFNVATASLISCLALTACTVHKTEAPPLAGPSDLALSTRLEANPDTIGQDGGSQSSIRVFANGPDGKPLAGVTFRVDMGVNTDRGLVTQDFGALSARSIVTGSDGVARVIYTAPAADPRGLTGTCNGLPGTCVTIIATPTSTAFGSVPPQTVTLRLVPLGVILPPAATPAPCMTISPASPTANTAVQFTAGTLVSGACTTASSDIVKFDWSFGDGTTGSGRTVAHTFTSANNFVVTLTETSDRGIAASATQTISVGTASVPTAVFTFSPAAPGLNETVFFNASTSTPGAGHTITSYQWTFGDGGSASGVTTTHKYAAAGTYTVQLTVTDEAGQSATSPGTQITVATGGGSAPTATFTFSPAAPGVNETVFFNASTSSGGAGRTIVSYAWTFGDGGTGSGVTVSHAYATAGTYSVQLRVTDDAGQSTTSGATTITVGSPPAPTAGFTISPTAPVVGQQVIFDASSSTTAQGQSIVDVAWNFGDGTPVIHCPGSSSADCPGPTNRISTHTYQSAQTFVVNLVVTDTAGRTAAVNKPITINSPFPTAVLNLFKSGGNSIQADGCGSTAVGGATIVSYAFVWGDGSNNTGSPCSVGHTYTGAGAAGSHTISLTVTDSNGRTNTISKDITTP